MAALRYEKIAAILERAHCIDRKCELFGASAHQYKLNSPIDAAIVRSAEEKYNFTLRDDICETDEFFVLGTHGCQWDFGLIVSGERKGQVFTADKEL